MRDGVIRQEAADRYHDARDRILGIIDPDPVSAPVRPRCIVVTLRSPGAATAETCSGHAPNARTSLSDRSRKGTGRAWKDPTMLDRTTRFTLVGLHLFLALTAIFGAVSVVPVQPREWLAARRSRITPSPPWR